MLSLGDVLDDKYAIESILGRGGMGVVYRARHLGLNASRAIKVMHRELAESIEVNPNTVMRTYGYMEDQGIIHNQRGIGFFLDGGAVQTTRELKKRIFVERDLPPVFRTMELLGLGFGELEGLYGERRAGGHRAGGQDAQEEKTS